MEGIEKRHLHGSDKPISRKKVQKDTRFGAKGKRQQDKCSLMDERRNIVANIGKEGIISEHPYFIYDEGYDVTPTTMESPLFPKIHPQEISNIYTIHDSSATTIKQNPSRSSLGSFSNYQILASMSAGYKAEGEIRSSFLSRISNVKQCELVESGGTFTLDQPIFTLEHSCSSEDLRIDEYQAPSMFRLRVDPSSKEVKLETTFIVNLTETETIFMLIIPSTADLLESKEGKLIYESNCLYENRLYASKMISETATQTDGIFNKNRKLYIPHNTRANASTFVTTWKIYDTYNALESSTSFQYRDQDEIIFLDDGADKAEYSINFEYSGSNFDNRLLVALMIMERLILNNTFRESHLSYNGMLVQDPLSLDVIYNYSLKHLWTFYSNNVVAKRAVTSISWNKADSNILAVGYGKFYYKDQCNGLVCIWNVKNPVQPERHYEFEHSVTFVTFHPIKKQILAVTFYNGSVFLIDIISWALLTKATNEHYPNFHAVWQARWFPSVNKAYGQILITCGKNGKVYRYRKNGFFTSKKVIKIGKVHGRIQGVEHNRPCYAKKTLTSTSVQVLVPHPLDTLVYLAGTLDGCIFICSILYRYEHLEVFQAHTGAVYSIQFNPFCKKVFLTCGADWCIRLWVEGVYAPLITLQSGLQPVEDAVWSPLHSTVILSVSGGHVEIWDVRRSTSKPKSTIPTPSASFNTILSFTANGYNVCIGDIEGNVHVMAMAEMPFSPTYQEDILLQSIMTALTTRPELTNKLKKLFKQLSEVKTSGFQTKMDHKLQQLIARANLLD